MRVIWTVINPTPMIKPHQILDLTTAAARENALDMLGQWFADSLASANGDREAATEIITEAIKVFYDIREAAGQYRGEYAGHFFMVDAIGLDDSDRPVPWVELAGRISPKHLTIYHEIFDDVERTTL